MPTLSKQHMMYAGGALVVLAVALATFFLSPKIPFGAEEKATENKPFLARTETITETADAYTIDMKYPQFDVPVVDTKIKQGVDAFIEEFKKEAAEKKPSEAKYELSSSFAGTYVDNEIISTRLSVSRFTGGAHPSTFMYGLNYAKDTGKEIGLKSVLTLIGATLSQVSEYSSAQLKEKLGDSFIPEGAAAKEENFWMYSINEKGVTFIFNEYQVAPYAAGPQRVTFARAVPITTPTE